MSDNEGATKKSGYRLEYASSARSKCKGASNLPWSPQVTPDADFSPREGAKPCSGKKASNACIKSRYTRFLGTPIPKGALRMGSIVDIRGHTNLCVPAPLLRVVLTWTILLPFRSAWRHWGCTTPKIITNMKEKFSSAEDLDGFEDLKEEDQERVRHAWEEGRVADEDIPETARKPADAEDDEKPKRKRAPAKKKDEAEEDEEEKPKRKRATKSKKVDEEAEDEAEAEDVEEKPKSAPARKPRAKVRATTHH
jgi:flagellar biosynthesis GTPase FlhF